MGRVGYGLPGHVTIAILMPSFNEGGRLSLQLAALAGEAKTVGPVTVYLVDDGSTVPVDLDALPPATPELRVVLARHRVNLGQGASLETARVMALADPANDVFVTMDSDGQHRPADLPAFVAAVRTEKKDAVFGNRFATASNMPAHRRLLLQAARVFEGVLTGLWLSDAHNGYRAFSRRAIEGIRLRQNRMAHATEIKQAIAARKRELAITELPVTIVYTDDTLAKGQSSLGAVQILRDLAFRFLFGPE